MDLTVPHAPNICDFYEKVVGWKSQGLDMGGYDDFCMNIPGSGETVAGICNARGENADLPAQWMIYITVADLSQSIEACKKLGGRILSGPREMGQGTVAFIEDPAGAVAALYQAK